MTYLLAVAGIREFGLLIEGELQRPRPPGDFDLFLITMISADEQEDDPINQPTTTIVTMNDTYLGDPGTESEFGVCEGVGAW